MCVGGGGGGRGGVCSFIPLFSFLFILVTQSGRVKLGLGTVPTHLHSVSEK